MNDFEIGDIIYYLNPLNNEYEGWFVCYLLEINDNKYKMLCITASDKWVSSINNQILNEWKQNGTYIHQKYK